MELARIAGEHGGGDVWFGEIEIITELRKLNSGDHIAVATKLPNDIKILHHGIYIDSKMGVIHVLCEDKPVILDDLFKFMKSKILVRVNYKGKCQKPQTVVENATKYLKDPELFGTFSFAENNCEHFATLCKTGERFSKQAIELIQTSIIARIALTFMSDGSESIPKTSDGYYGSSGSKRCTLI